MLIISTPTLFFFNFLARDTSLASVSTTGLAMKHTIYCFYTLLILCLSTN